MPGRDEELQHIRDTYAGYRERRSHLWSTDNPGFARIVEDRDRALAGLIADSTMGRTDPRVLDVGCGPGRLASVLRGAGMRVSFTGLDLLPEMLDAALMADPSASWVQGSADRLPFADGSFDVVVASTLFSSLPQGTLEVAVAAEIGRVLAEDGLVVWYDLRYPSPGNRSVRPITRGRLSRLFPGWRAELRTITLLPPLARRLGWATTVAYPLLERIPVLRSHLVGRLRRLDRI
ncbi:MAG: class I SAM-dependent methyltransferase [Candidatus Limnocylindria bacterium]